MVAPPAILFVLANPFLIIVLFALLAMNAEWKISGKTKTQHAILGAVVTALGCIPFLAVDSMPLGLLGALLLIGLLSHLSYGLGKDPQKAVIDVTGPNPAKIRASATRAIVTTRKSTSPSGTEVWIDGEWVPVEDVQ